MTEAAIEHLTVEELARRLREAEPDAVLVRPRLLRRLIRRLFPGSAVGLQLPHRKGLVVEEAEVARVLPTSRFGLAEGGLPSRTLILLAAPDPRRLAEATESQVLCDYWRLLFHARIHEALERRQRDGHLSPTVVRERIHQIGEVEFDEIRSVLRREAMLLPPADDPSVFVEFAAVFLELRAFAPQLLPDYFPSLGDPDRVAALLAEDLDAPDLLERTRPEGAPDPASLAPATSPGLDDEIEGPFEADSANGQATRRLSAGLIGRLLDEASRAEELGNDVRAAILRTRAARMATPALAGQARSSARFALDRLARRLQAALGFDDDERAAWQKALRSLQESSAVGIWPAAARLLYDLQAVCLDHERETYKIDLVEWTLSLGRRSIKRLLPNQREVSQSKHLRRADHRLGRVRLDPSDRAVLVELLRRAVDRAEEQLRERFRPLIRRALELADLRPANVPERVASRKIVEELLDLLVDRGYLTFGDLRDALSRNQLKLPDLNPKALIRGDRLLRADHRLGISLDGVYRRAEVYLRGLQKGSSIAFGTWLGRILTLYLAIPFGGAFFALEGLQHLIEPVVKFFGPDSHAEAGEAHGASGAGIHLVNPVSVVVLGALVFGMIHSPAFRWIVMRALRGLGRLAEAVLIDVPAWVLSRPLVRAVLLSRPVVWARRWVLEPAAVTVAACLIFRVGEYERESLWVVGSITYVVSALIFNSRMGREVEEELVDQAQVGWSRVTSELLPGLYSAIMAFFDRVLEGVDRVLYGVDEWLRFRSGQSRLTLAAKAVLGVVWSAVAYVVRFCVNLLIEPQVNPIKHFPVVTVAHKLTLPFMLALPAVLEKPPFGLSQFWSGGIAAILQFFLPGVFGFLVWELKENWRLYAANRPHDLKPVPVGSHGETVVRLVRHGLHSGTLPKTYDRLRKTARRAIETGRFRDVHRQREKLRHVEHAMAHFVDREFCALLHETSAMRDVEVSVAEVFLATDRIRVGLDRQDRPGETWVVAFEEQSGWLVAGTIEPGWTSELGEAPSRVLALAWSGLLKQAGVDLLREQIQQALEPPDSEYDVIPAGLIAWLPGRPETAVPFDLRQEGGRGPSVATPPGQAGPSLDCDKLRFGREPIPWSYWVDVWEREASGQGAPPMPPTGSVLPREASELPRSA